LTYIQKILKYQISQKSVQCESSCSKWTERWTDRHNEAKSCCLQFCKHA